MTDFRLDLERESWGVIPLQYEVISRISVEVPGVTLHSAWRAESGHESLFVSAPAEVDVSEIVGRYGLGIDAVAVVTDTPLDAELPALFPKPEVYCERHRGYHPKPACA